MIQSTFLIFTNKLDLQLLSIQLQPAPTFTIVRKHLLHLLPKGWRVIVMNHVAQLVDHHVINDIMRCHNDGLVKAYVTDA
jgi:hypothetical protein